MLSLVALALWGCGGHDLSDEERVFQGRCSGLSPYLAAAAQRGMLDWPLAALEDMDRRFSQSPHGTPAPWSWRALDQLGTASCRTRVLQYVYIQGVALSVNQ